jgi:hypothetical protein
LNHVAADHFRAYPRRRDLGAMAVRVVGSRALLRLVDLGIGGAGVEGQLVLEPGARIDLVLSLPTRWDPLVVPARVAWAHAGRAGLAFEHRDDAEAYALFELLSAQAFEP